MEWNEWKWNGNSNQGEGVTGNGCQRYPNHQFGPKITGARAYTPSLGIKTHKCSLYALVEHPPRG